VGTDAALGAVCREYGLRLVIDHLALPITQDSEKIGTAMITDIGWCVVGR
jgi:hypothetical protein